MDRFWLVVLTAASCASSHAATCDGIAVLKLKDTTILTAVVVGAGEFAPSSAAPTSPIVTPYRILPAFCRVTGILKPSADSNIQFEVWMPATDWNGKLQGVGNGGFAGSIQYGPMAGALGQNYAVVNSDTGHTGSDATWALGHPEKLIDYGYRAVHETTVLAKKIVVAFYGNGPRRSYFSSCSNGGRQALMEAQRYPADYDGIIAGAPANDFTHLVSGFAWNTNALMLDPASYIPPAKIKAMADATVASCDARDGVADGVIDDPTRCHFDPSVLLCKAEENNSCLTAPQVAALKKIYSGPITSKGRRIFPGYLPGGEMGAFSWSGWITGAAPGRGAQFSFATQFFMNMVFGDPKWDFKTFNVDKDVWTADKKVAKILNSVDPDLSAFRARGGKLILWHGWSDPAIAAERTIQYFQAVQHKMGSKKTSEFVRLYMVPGLQHCAGGPGPNMFGAAPGTSQPDPNSDMSAAIERWVDTGTVPDSIVAVKRASDFDPASKLLRTRPLCPYPQVARYQGSGSTDDAANFSCEIPSYAKRK